MLGITYALHENAPTTPTHQLYANYLRERYNTLLDDDIASEKDYQSFFESHPCMVPGHNFGNQNHGVHNWSLISQPIIQSDVKRKPDFLWITETSAELIPVFIEIETPGKNLYRKFDATQNALYSQASDQIEEWRVILSDIKAQADFCDRYEIPETLFTTRKFSPRFILIYGRREEFFGSKMLSAKRANKQRDDFQIMSFDRLSPSFDAMHYVTTRYRTGGQIDVLAVPPTFQLGPAIAGHLTKWNGLDSAIKRCPLISEDRRTFLINRKEYWRNWFQSSSNAFRTGDWE